MHLGSQTARYRSVLTVGPYADTDHVEEDERTLASGLEVILR